MPVHQYATVVQHRILSAQVSSKENYDVWGADSRVKAVIRNIVINELNIVA